MWCPGSLPCQYSPMHPRRSFVDNPSVNTLDQPVLKTESSFSINFSLPPIKRIIPGTSCGTNHEYCELVASVTSFKSPPPPKACGSNGVRQLPFESFGRIQPI